VSAPEKNVAEEAERYLEAVEVFRDEGIEPKWLAEHDEDPFVVAGDKPRRIEVTEYDRV
jgi:hypothetical protein